MLNLNRLPLCILKIILLHSVSERFEGLEDWKRHIPLVGVCKQWTSILRSVVFRTAYIDYDLYYRQCIWMTNVDCIAIRGWFNNVKILNICIRLPANNMMVVNKLQSILQLDTINWASITQLNINFNSLVPRRPSNYLGILDKCIVDFAQRLISEMPNIVSLRSCQIYKANFLQQLMLLVVNAYSGRLKLLDIWPILNMPTTHLGSNLAYLTLGFDDNISINYIISICAEPLRELHLHNVPVNIPWHIFHSNSDSGQINFKNLQKLTILYNIEYDNDYSDTQIASVRNAIASNYNNSTGHTIPATNNAYTYRLIFPKLRKLEIQNCPNNVNSLNAKFGCTLNSFKLTGQLQYVLKWITIPLRTLKLAMEIRVNKSVTTTENTHMLNILLNVTTHYQSRSLNLNSGSGKLHLSSVIWGNLNELIISKVDITDIITLLSTIPRLKKIKFDSIQLDDCDTIENVEQHFLQRVDTQVFARCLTTLVIRYIDHTYDNIISLAVIYNLMTHAKLLSQLEVPEQFVNQLMKIIEAQKDYYPHFSKMQIINVKLSFYCQYYKVISFIF